MSQMKFPNLFIIGAMKSGTTSLHDCLALHPEIFMAEFKEPQYFAPHRIPFYGMWGQGHPYPEPGIDWYLRLFDDAGDVRYAGESSTTYTKEPLVTGCAERISRFNPDAKLIYIMRDPAERAISHYWHQVVSGRENRPMLRAMRRDESYVAVSHYARQLRPYLERFGREAIYLLTLEEMISDPERTLRGLFGWLGLDAGPATPDFRHRNEGRKTVAMTRRGLMAVARLRRHWRWKRIEGRYPGIARRAHALLTRPVDRTAVDVKPVRDYLRRIQRGQIEELAELVGRRFPEWDGRYAIDSMKLLT